MKLLLFIILSFVCGSLLAQPSSGVTKALKKLYPQLTEHMPDSARADLLLDLSAAYTKANMPDSAIFYARQALSLSRSANYLDGYDQAYFQIVKNLASMENILDAYKMANAAGPALKIRTLLELGEHYIFKSGAFDKTLDSGLAYVKSAMKLSDSIHSVEGKENSLSLLGKYYYGKGNIEEGEKCLMQVVQYYQKTGDKKNEGRWWGELFRYTPIIKSTFGQILFYAQKEVELYKLALDKKNTAYALRDRATAEMNLLNFNQAGNDVDSALAILKELNVKKLYTTYQLRSFVESAKGNFNGALKYGLLMIKNMDSLQEDYLAGQVYQIMGEIYWNLNNYEQSLQWFEKSLSNIKGQKEYLIYDLAWRISNNMILLGKKKEALQFLINFDQIHHPVWATDKETMMCAMGDCYFSLKEYDKAEKAYEEMLTLEKQATDELGKKIRLSQAVTGSEAYFKIGKFYVDRQKFDKARPLLMKGLDTSMVVLTWPTVFRDIHELLYKVDSAKGDYISAMRQQILFKSISDSITNDKKNKEISELQIQYETENKDNNILLLNQKAKLDDANLAKSNWIRNITTAGVFFLLIILGLIFYQFRLNQRKNRLISEKNKSLEQLVKDKDWLVKEIHHRVKNNLQTIVSLLESQSANLKTEALEAVQDSRNRVYAMSLIHQKLYQQDFVSSINMASYLPDMVENLKESFDLRQRIRFSLQIDPIILDVSQAIPVALILNETIINAIKYAFPEDRPHNEIKIKMSGSENGLAEFKVEDNGIGLPVNYETLAESGLGIRLIKGLTEDLHGTFEIKSINGTSITILFKTKAILNEGAN